MGIHKWITAIFRPGYYRRVVEYYSRMVTEANNDTRLFLVYMNLDPDNPGFDGMAMFYERRDEFKSYSELFSIYADLNLKYPKALSKFKTRSHITKLTLENLALICSSQKEIQELQVSLDAQQLKKEFDKLKQSYGEKLSGYMDKFPGRTANFYVSHECDIEDYHKALETHCSNLKDSCPDGWEEYLNRNHIIAPIRPDDLYMIRRDDALIRALQNKYKLKNLFPVGYEMFIREKGEAQKIGRDGVRDGDTYKAVEIFVKALEDKYVSAKELFRFSPDGCLSYLHHGSVPFRNLKHEELFKLAVNLPDAKKYISKYAEGKKLYKECEKDCVKYLKSYLECHGGNIDYARFAEERAGIAAYRERVAAYARLNEKYPEGMKRFLTVNHIKNVPEHLVNGNVFDEQDVYQCQQEADKETEEQLEAAKWNAYIEVMGKYPEHILSAIFKGKLPAIGQNDAEIKSKMAYLTAYDQLDVPPLIMPNTRKLDKLRKENYYSILGVEKDDAGVVFRKIYDERPVEDLIRLFNLVVNVYKGQSFLHKWVYDHRDDLAVYEKEVELSVSSVSEDYEYMISHFDEIMSYEGAAEVVSRGKAILDKYACSPDTKTGRSYKDCKYAVDNELLLAGQHEEYLERIRLDRMAEQEHVLKQCVSGWPVPVMGLSVFSEYYYYPTTCDFNVSDSDWGVRRLIWDFKNTEGKTSDQEHELALVQVVALTAKVVKHFFGSYAKELTLVCIPASTRNAHERRYRDFARLICKETGMMCSFDEVHIVSEKTPRHLGGTGVAEYGFHESFFKDKFVLIFDDVITKGNSIYFFKRVLERMGAKVIGGITIGKTIHTIQEAHPICLL